MFMKEKRLKLLHRESEKKQTSKFNGWKLTTTIKETDDVNTATNLVGDKRDNLDDSKCK